MDGVCSTSGKYIQDFSWKLETRRQVVKRRLTWGIILEWTFRKQCVEAWTGFN
jgi:hypothetical protein